MTSAQPRGHSECWCLATDYFWAWHATTSPGAERFLVKRPRRQPDLDLNHAKAMPVTMPVTTQSVHRHAYSCPSPMPIPVSMSVLVLQYQSQCQYTCTKDNAFPNATVISVSNTVLHAHPERCHTGMYTRARCYSMYCTRVRTGVHCVPSTRVHVYRYGPVFAVACHGMVLSDIAILPGYGY